MNNDLTIGQRHDGAIAEAKLGITLFIWAWEIWRPGKGLASIWLEVDQ